MTKRDSERQEPRWSPIVICFAAAIVVGIGALICLQFWYGEQVKALMAAFGASLYEPKNAEAYLRYQSFEIARGRCLLGVICLTFVGAVLALVGQPRRRPFLPNDQNGTPGEVSLHDRSLRQEGKISWIDVNNGVRADFRRIGADGSRLYIDWGTEEFRSYPWSKVFVCDKDAAMLVDNRFILLRAVNARDTFDRDNFDQLILRRIPTENFLSRSKFYPRLIRQNLGAWIVVGCLTALLFMPYDGTRPGYGNLMIIWLSLMVSTALLICAPYAMWRRYQGKPFESIDGKPVAWQMEAMGFALGLVGVFSTVPGLFFNQPYWAINHVFRLIGIVVGGAAR